MSFAGQVKQELCRQIPSARHCRIAELAALLSFCGIVQVSGDDGISLLFQTEQEAVCGVFLMLLKKTFRLKEEQIRYERQIRAKTSAYRVLLEDRETVSVILHTMNVLDENGSFTEDVPLSGQKILAKPCCRKAYLRGAFLAAGALSDPKRSYHLEFLCQDRGTAGELAELLATLGITAAWAGRGKYFPVYIKDGSQLSDLLGILGARVAMLDFENARIMREVRGNINRKVNCETANIRKTANAAAEQIEDIRYIEKTAGLRTLPVILDETARIRLQYPTATLQELGELMDPPVGKSGMNHRLRKISMFAAKLREDQGGARKHVE